MLYHEIRAKWREAGGKFHGPHVETGTMEEAKLLPFLAGLYGEIARLQVEIERLKSDREAERESDALAGYGWHRID